MSPSTLVFRTLSFLACSQTQLCGRAACAVRRVWSSSVSQVVISDSANGLIRRLNNITVYLLLLTN